MDGILHLFPVICVLVFLLLCVLVFLVICVNVFFTFLYSKCSCILHMNRMEWDRTGCLKYKGMNRMVWNE